MKFLKSIFVIGLIIGAFVLGYYACKLGWIDTALDFFKGISAK